MWRDEVAMVEAALTPRALRHWRLWNRAHVAARSAFLEAAHEVKIDTVRATWLMEQVERYDS